MVFWRIKDATKFLFNIQNPEVTVKDVAESAMRDIVGQSNIQPLLTGAREKTEQAVQMLMQNGWSNVIDQRAGFDGARDPFGQVREPGWKPAGLPTETGDGGAGSYSALKK